MEKPRILFVSQEIMPYLPESPMSIRGRYLPQGIQERGKEIRAFMPRYGSVNERRNQLHEVIRLSGMNLIIDDTDHPLIIKVASIQAARMQVYFIDNEDYFHRKAIIGDKNGKAFEDNDERAIFFARGVLETVKKLRWSPDIVHCQGWITSFVPLFLKRSYNDDPLFTNTKVVFTPFDEKVTHDLNENLPSKLMFGGVKKTDLQVVEQPSFINAYKLGVEMSDAIIHGEETINEELKEFIENKNMPTLPYQDDMTYIDEYNKFYDKIL